MPNSAYVSTDVKSKACREAYGDLIGRVEQGMDPHKNTVLVVDDSLLIRAMVAGNIRRSDPGLVVVEAADGRECLDKLKEIRVKYMRDPALIVLDLEMPVMSGWDVIAALQKEYEALGLRHGIPIIVLSSSSGERGLPFFRTSVHSGKATYVPLVSVSKENCATAVKYDVAGVNGLIGCLRHFLHAPSDRTESLPPGSAAGKSRGSL